MILFLKDEPAPLTMSSREIAELLEKRHDKVKQSSRTGLHAALKNTAAGTQHGGFAV
ncbi:hypothetical protein [Mameliella sp.]|uniref:hypothetical protein n=1 Tax=Mameliella sp. TaxID=1924940 RepID=UPI003BAA2751